MTYSAVMDIGSRNQSKVWSVSLLYEQNTAITFPPGVKMLKQALENGDKKINVHVYLSLARSACKWYLHMLNATYPN